MARGISFQIWLLVYCVQMGSKDTFTQGHQAGSHTNVNEAELIGFNYAPQTGVFL